MKILVVNGSPKGNKSNTNKLTTAFVEGMNVGGENNVKNITIANSHIEPCIGCYGCWTKTPGKCVIKDDMADFLEEYRTADIVIWSFPLYYFGMPSKIKGFMDRLLPNTLPTLMKLEDGTGTHPERYNLSHQKHVLVSTCGFYSKENNYDALFCQFNRVFGDRLTKIICPEGELFRVPQLAARTNEYLSYVKTAGEEFSICGQISEVTQNKLDELLYPVDVFIEMGNANWDLELANNNLPPLENQKQQDASYAYIRQMAALYNPARYKKDIVLEMNFTDINKTYQLLLGKEKCSVKIEDFTDYTTRIETPYDVWQKIATGEINGAKGMMDGLYKVKGDFNTMLDIGSYFGLNKTRPKTESKVQKNSKMLLLLLPFLALWIVLPINAVIGGAAAIVAACLVNILHLWWKPTPYESVGSSVCILVGLLAVTNTDIPLLMSIPSFTFGLMWLTSCFLKIPLCAYYSYSSFGGEESAFNNPLFIRTNRILAAIWGISSLLTATASIFIAGTAVKPFWGGISYIPTIILGLFTVWFVKWYPAKVARG